MLRNKNQKKKSDLKLRGGGSRKQIPPKKIVSGVEEINCALNCLHGFAVLVQFFKKKFRVKRG